MKDLRALVEELGYQDVRTHLQSGNVLVTTRKRSESAIADELCAGIARATGLSIPVLVRTRVQLEAIVADDPFAGARTDASRHMVAFLAEPPGPHALARLEDLRRDDELLHANGREVHAWFPAGLHASRLGSALHDDKALSGPTTVRNWRTVTALAELAAS
jgi:uncharacterized protein (DUF1697 family)